MRASREAWELAHVLQPPLIPCPPQQPCLANWILRGRESAMGGHDDGKWSGGGCWCLQEPYMIADEPTRPPRAVPRMTSSLTHSEYYWRFARPGIPVVVAGMCDGPEWVERGRKVLACCGQRPESQMCGSMKCDDIKHAHKSHQANFCSNECATLAYPGHMDFLPQTFRFPHPLPSLSQIFDDPPWVVAGAAGATFGSPGHYDNGCSGSISIQLHGRKLWTLWAPWDVDVRDEDAAETTDEPSDSFIQERERFEAMLEPGDAIVYPPGWFHSTAITEDGASAAVAWWVDLIPSFGAGESRSNTSTAIARSPFGFGSCATGTKSWARRTAAWDEHVDRPAKRVLRDKKDEL